jgi:hypothetical protein
MSEITSFFFTYHQPFYLSMSSHQRVPPKPRRLSFGNLPRKASLTKQAGIPPVSTLATHPSPSSDLHANGRKPRRLSLQANNSTKSSPSGDLHANVRRPRRLSLQFGPPPSTLAASIPAPSPSHDLHTGGRKPRRLSLQFGPPPSTLAANNPTPSPSNALHATGRKPRRLSLQFWPRRRSLLNVQAAQAASSNPSQASTVTADDDFSASSSTNRGKANKMVRFANQDMNGYFDNEQMFEDECRGLWLSNDDLRIMQESVEVLVENSERADDELSARNVASYTKILLAVYGRCTEYNMETFTTTATTVDDSITPSNLGVLTDNELHELAKRLKVYSSRLGMERRIVPEFRQVLIEQKLHMLEQIRKIQNNNVDMQQNNAEQIRQACERISQPSRLFYLSLAQAHAASLKR